MTHFYFLFFKLIIKCTCFSLSKALGREHHRKPIVSTPTVYLNSCLCDVHSALLFTLADSLSPMSCCKNDTASPQPPAPEDLSIVCFTSGTTGTPQHLNDDDSNPFVFGTRPVAAACCHHMDQDASGI